MATRPKNCPEYALKKTVLKNFWTKTDLKKVGCKNGLEKLDFEIFDFFFDVALRKKQKTRGSSCWNTRRASLSLSRFYGSLSKGEKPPKRLYLPRQTWFVKCGA